MMLTFLKRKSDGTMLTLEAKRLEAHLLWKDRVEPPHEADDKASLMDERGEGNGEDGEDTNEDENDVVASLLDLNNVEQC